MITRIYMGRMAASLVTLQHYHQPPHSPPTLITALLNSPKPKPIPPNLNNPMSGTGRRIAITATVSTILFAKEAIFNVETASCLDFRLVAPDQTVEQAQSTVKGHAQDLLDIKDIIELESWKELQKTMRKSSAYLKQDIYTLIQSKPGRDRPLLRKIYSQLFNNVSRLDYAARDKDAALVHECYNNIVVALKDIMSRL